MSYFCLSSLFIFSIIIIIIIIIIVVVVVVVFIFFGGGGGVVGSNLRLKYTSIFFSYFKSRFQLDVGVIN